MSFDVEMLRIESRGAQPSDKGLLLFLVDYVEIKGDEHGVGAREASVGTAHGSNIFHS